MLPPPPLPPLPPRCRLMAPTTLCAALMLQLDPQTLQQMVDAFNANCISVVPSQGTVGASGDLAPLSHLALGLMGEGPMWDPVRSVVLGHSIRV